MQSSIVKRLHCDAYSAAILQVDSECYWVKVYKWGEWFADWYCDSIDEAEDSFYQELT